MLAHLIPTLLVLALATAQLTPTTTTTTPLEIDTKIATEYPYPNLTPFWTPPAPSLVGRNWEWASIPAWYTPSPPSPSSPHYYNAAEHKATLTHEIIAAIIVGIFIGFPVLGCVCVWGYRRCWVKRRRGRDVERGRRLVRDCERKRIFVDGEYVTRLTERPDMVHWGKDRR